MTVIDDMPTLTEPDNRSGMDRLREAFAAHPDASNAELAAMTGLAEKSVKLYKTKIRKEQGKTAPAPARKAPRAAQVKAAKADSKRPYVAGIAGLVTLAGAGVGMVANAKRDAALAADAVTIGMYAEPLGEAVQQMADSYPNITPWLDRVCAAGPFGALLTPVMAITLQIATNHGKIPAGTMGTIDPHQLVDDAVTAAQEQMADAAPVEPGNPVA